MSLSIKLHFLTMSVNQVQQDDDSQLTEISATSSLPSTASSYKSYLYKINEDEYIDTYISIPPDGGWGWIVVFASFICNFVADGAIYTFGIFLEDIANTYDTKSSTVSIGSSLMTGFYFMSGINKFSVFSLNNFLFQALLHVHL